MSVYRRGKIFWYRFQRQGREFRGSCGTTIKREARAVEQRIRDRLDDQAAGTLSIGLDELLGRYWLEHAQTLKSADATWYCLKRLRQILGDVPVRNMPDARIAEFVARRRGDGVAAGTINREIKTLRAALIRARDLWSIDVGKLPNWRAHFMTEPGERIRSLRDDEQARILEHLWPDMAPLFLFSIEAGLRMDNALTLTWRQIDRDAGVIELRVKSAEPGGRVHWIPITPAVERILAMTDQAATGPVFTYTCRRDNPRAKRRKGERYPFTKSTIARPWRQALTAAGVEDFRWHDLRHTSATRLLRSSRNLKLVQRLLGHQDISTTAKYAHADLEDLRDAMTEAEAAPAKPKLIREG